jgi:hypothetical protein
LNKLLAVADDPLRSEFLHQRTGVAAWRERRGRASVPGRCRELWEKYQLAGGRQRPGTNAGRTFRLKGKGMPVKGGHGDLFATVRIVLPDGKDPELEELMRKWREQKPYNPRKDFG